MNEKACLAYDPFAGDRDSDAQMKRDLFVVTRKAHACTICADAIPAGARVRARTELSREEAKIMTFYFCLPCCWAMSVVQEDDGKAIESRTTLGMVRAGTLPKEALS